MASFVVRQVEESDLDQLLELYHELAEGDAARMPAGAELSRDVLLSIVADRSRYLCVAVDDQQVLGSAELIVLLNLTHHARPWGVIENVIVSGSVRRRGVGTAMMEHLLELARAQSCYKVQLHSGKQRADAHRLYRRLGFKSVAEGFKLYFDDTRSPWGGAGGDA